MRQGFCIAVVVILMVCLTGAASGQAWVSPKGTGSISISYINSLDNRDFFGHGENYILIPPNPQAPNGLKLQDFGRLRTQGMYLDLAYSLTDKLGVSLSIPYLAPKYTAPANETNAFFAAHRFADGTVPLDDGHYHGSFQDFGLRIRYNITAHPFMLTPFVQLNQPSHHYLTYSHAIVGRGVRSIAIGSYVGRTLGPLLPDAYAQANYMLAFDEKVLNISRKRSLIETEFGYFIRPDVRAFTVLSGQVTHGGLNAPYDVLPPVPENPLFFHHSQITRDNYLNIGIGGQYSINDRVDLFALVSRMLTARNMHGLDYGITIGMSWGFGGSPQRPCHC